jgi:acylphosphatase
VSDAVRAHLFVAGRVQGVGFRFSAVSAARTIGGLSGWVRNLDDGRVELVVQGPKDRVEQLVGWCRRGPPSARVEALESSWEAVDGALPEFEIS